MWLPTGSLCRVYVQSWPQRSNNKICSIVAPLAQERFCGDQSSSFHKKRRTQSTWASSKYNTVTCKREINPSFSNLPQKTQNIYNLRIFRFKWLKHILFVLCSIYGVQHLSFTGQCSHFPHILFYFEIWCDFFSSCHVSHLCDWTAHLNVFHLCPIGFLQLM